MENVEIPDDFYMPNCKILCHKSCLYVDNKFSNYRHVYTHGIVNDALINSLRSKCNFYDKIEETTCFTDGRFNNLRIDLYDYGGIGLYNINNLLIVFHSLDEVLQYLQKKYPECIKTGDIKIALKD